MNGISGSFDEAVRRMGDVLAITGRVLPVTNQNVYLEAEFDNGSRVLGESKIFYAKKINDCRIRQVRLVPENPPALQDSLDAIACADIIVLGPGSLYTSIIPNFLVSGISEAIAASGAVKAFIMTSVLDSSAKISEYMGECKQMGIAVLPPDVNESDDDFTVVPEGIRFGLAAVKNIGRGFIQKVMAERAENGRFTDLEDFCRRLFGTDLNKRALENLIKCGACDGFGLRRSQMLQIYEDVMDSVASGKRRNVDGQLGLFDGFGDGEKAPAIQAPDLPELTAQVRMLFISSFFIRSILEPLSQITATAKRIAAGSYGVQIPKRYDDEIGELADTINDMYGEGISRWGEILDLGAQLELIEKSGSWYSIDGERIGQGRDNAKQYLADHPDVADRIEQGIRENLWKLQGERAKAPITAPAKPVDVSADDFSDET